MRPLLPAAVLALVVLGPAWLLRWPLWVVRLLAVPEGALCVVAVLLMERRPA